MTQNNSKFVTHRSSARTPDLALPRRGPAPSEERATSRLATLPAPRVGNGKPQSALGANSELTTFHNRRELATPFNSHWVPASALPRPRQIGVAGYVDGVPVRVFEPRPAADLDESVLSNRLRVTWGRRRHAPEE